MGDFAVGGCTGQVPGVGKVDHPRGSRKACLFFVKGDSYRKRMLVAR